MDHCTYQTYFKIKLNFSGWHFEDLFFFNRDVKPENLLMSSTTFKAGEKPTVKLADLGLGVPVEGNKQIKFESIAGMTTTLSDE